MNWSFSNRERKPIVMPIMTVIAVTLMCLFYAEERTERVRLGHVMERVKLWNDCRPPFDDETVRITREWSADGKSWRFKCEYVSYLSKETQRKKGRISQWM